MNTEGGSFDEFEDFEDDEDGTDYGFGESAKEIFISKMTQLEREKERQAKIAFRESLRSGRRWTIDTRGIIQERKGE